jgi:hypothetical protein
LDAVSYKNPRTAVALSAVLPGAGQLYNGKLVKAAVIMGAESYTLYKAREYHRMFEKDRTDKDVQINRNKHLWYTAGIYVYAMLDALVDAHLSSFPEGSLVLDPERRGVCFVLTMEF